MRPVPGPNRLEKERFGFGLTVLGDSDNDGKEEHSGAGYFILGHKAEKKGMPVCVCVPVDFLVNLIQI